MSKEETPLEKQFREDCEAVEQQWQEVGKPLWEMLNRMIPRDTGEEQQP